MARIAPHRCVLLAAVVAVLAAGCGIDPVIEGLYRDESVIVSSTCGSISIDPVVATVQLHDDVVVVELAAPTFGRSSDATAILRLDASSEVTVQAEEDAFCGVVSLAGGEVVSAAVSGAVEGVTTTTTPTPRVGFRRHETLERLPSADNALRLRQTLRFEDVDVCVDGRSATVPPRDCELTRIIDLRLQEACPAERQRAVRLRLGEAIFCSIDDAS